MIFKLETSEPNETNICPVCEKSMELIKTIGPVRAENYGTFMVDYFTDYILLRFKCQRQAGLFSKCCGFREITLVLTNLTSKFK